MLAGVPLAFGAGWAWPGLFNLAVVLANPASPGAATGITQTGTYMGAVLGPLLFGFLAEHLSFGWSWVVAAAYRLGGGGGHVDRAGNAPARPGERGPRTS